MKYYNISDEQIEHIAKLARISLSTDEKKKFPKELSSILGYVQKIDEVETKGIALSPHLDQTNRLREDACKKPLDSDDALSNRASQSHAGYFATTSVKDQR